jgi:mono/diheme cytochrome c family protein
MMMQHARRHMCARSTLTLAVAVFMATLAGAGWNESEFLPTPVLSAQATSTTYRDVYDGWKWWHVYCYRCHGTNAVATSLAPDLIDPNRKLSNAQFLKVVREGIPDKGMQGWDQLLDPKQINQIHLYVLARTDKVLPPGRVDEVGPNGGPWVPPNGWPKK